jgi:methanogenic corrinoid protein MtbC1
VILAGYLENGALGVVGGLRMDLKLIGEKVVEGDGAAVESLVRDGVKILVGAAPLTQECCDEIGADGYAPDASSAVKKAKELLGVV